MDNAPILQIERTDRRFIYRTAGVAMDRDRVLIHRSQDDDFWALPGGRVEMGEVASEALAREMQEELGIQVEVGRLLWITENFFTYAGYACHELALYFLMTLPPDAPLRR
ncbi:MAG: NUDIX hydrolase, partial [Anaerolineales bacterium]